MPNAPELVNTEDLTAARRAVLLEAGNLLLDARRTGNPIQTLPPELEPQTLAEAYFVQDNMAVAFEPIGGWKIGAPSAEADPVYAPMPAMGIGGTTGLQRVRYRGVEAEIAFLVGRDLPASATPYSREEVLDAIASCHPAIEVLESAFIDPEAVPRLSMIADMQMHGGFVYGPACPQWRQVDFSKEQVTLAVDGAVRVERTGSNTAGDLLRLLPWLANQGAARTGGLRAGQWITTGSWTGNTTATMGSAADVRFSTIGRVNTRFA